MAIRRLFDFGVPAQSESTSVRSAVNLSCITCGLHKGVQSPRMQPFGEFRSGIMLIGGAPSEVDDREGIPWQAKAGSVLKSTLRRLGVDLERDCLSLNAVNCRPPNDRSSTSHEQACCRAKIVEPAILEDRPKVIILLGGDVTASVLGQISPDISSSIYKWRGFQIPIPEWGCYVCPTFHPDFIIGDNQDLEVIWKKDIEAAINLLNAPVPKPIDLRRRVTILRDEESILRELGKIKDALDGWFSFDYETTGIQPQIHKLISASFCYSEEMSYAFMWTGSERVKKAFRDALVNPDVGKVAHNIKFEQGWSQEHLGVDKIEWAVDTMLAAHVIDNRSGICSLKLQAFLNFGIKPYEKLITPFLGSPDKEKPHAPNTIDKFIERYGEDELLLYNGIDSLVTYMLAAKQMKMIGRYVP